MKPVFFFAPALALVLGLAACGRAPSSGPETNATAPEASIAVQEAYAAPSPQGVDLAAGYVTLTNTGAEDRLVAASSPRAASVELHTMAMDGPVMRMRKVESLIVPAGGDLVLAPGGDHLMFMGLSAPFATGEDIPVSLTFERAGEIQITLPVRAPGSPSDEHSGAH